MRVLVEDDLLHTDVYSKPTDAHQYLNYKSCHSLLVKRGILCGLDVRFTVSAFVFLMMFLHGVG